MTAGQVPAGHQATQSACQGVPDPAGSSDQAVPGQTAGPSCSPRPELGLKSEIEADCPAAGQTALGLALGPGIRHPRKSQTQRLTQSKRLITLQTESLPKSLQGASPAWPDPCSFFKVVTREALASL